MPVRRPYARQFYPGDCRTQIENFLKGYAAPEEPAKVVAGIVPHAGWGFSGAVAARVFKCISLKTDPDTFILLGAVHTWKPKGISIYGRGSWETPLGEIKIDEETAERLIEHAGGEIIEDPAAHEGEHSIEVQAPFIKYLCPDARIVPVAVLPEDNVQALGEKIAEAVLGSGRKIVVVGTTDLTHYGDNYGFTPYGYGNAAKKRMKENDLRIIELAVNMKADEIITEARRNHNACGSGALAATVSAAKAMGADKGHLLEYTTSHDVMPEGEFYMAVGYAGIVF